MYCNQFASRLAYVVFCLQKKKSATYFRVYLSKLCMYCEFLRRALDNSSIVISLQLQLDWSSRSILKGPLTCERNALYTWSIITANDRDVWLNIFA